MNYVEPREGTLTQLYNGVEYKATYYKPALSITGVTDESYPLWDGSATFNDGDYCILNELKTIYRSAIASNSSYPPVNPTSWINYGPVNSFAMFASDENIGSSTSGTDMVIEFDFSKSDTFAMIDCDFKSVLVEQLDESSTVISSETISGADYSASSYGEYYYSDKDSKTRIIKTDLEWMPATILRLTFSGDVTIGTFAYGLKKEMGITLYGTKMEIDDSSKFKVNEFTGFRTVIRKGIVRTLDVKLIFKNNEFNHISQVANKIMGKNIIWIPTKLDKFSELITIGYIERFPIPIDNPTMIETNSTIVGVSK